MVVGGKYFTEVFAEVRGHLISAIRLRSILQGFINGSGLYQKNSGDFRYTGLKITIQKIFKVVDAKNLAKGDTVLIDFRGLTGHNLSWEMMSSYLRDGIHFGLMDIKQDFYEFRAPVHKKIPLKTPGHLQLQRSCSCGEGNCQGGLCFLASSMCPF